MARACCILQILTMSFGIEFQKELLASCVLCVEIRSICKIRSVRSCTKAPHFELSVHPLCSHQTRCCPPLIGHITKIMSMRTPHATFLPLTMVTEGRLLVPSCWSPECHLSLCRWRRHSGFTHSHGVTRSLFEFVGSVVLRFVKVSEWIMLNQVTLDDQWLCQCIILV